MARAGGLEIQLSCAVPDQSIPSHPAQATLTSGVQYTLCMFVLTQAKCKAAAPCIEDDNESYILAGLLSLNHALCFRVLVHNFRACVQINKRHTFSMAPLTDVER